MSFQAKPKRQETARLSVWSCWGRLVYIQQQSSSSRVIPRYVSIQQCSSQKHETDRSRQQKELKWLIQLLNTAMLAPSHWQISTTVYLHAQFVASFAAGDSVPTLASRRVWHFIIAKLRNGKFCFLCCCLFVCFFPVLKRSQEAATQCSTSKPQKKKNAL